MKEVKEIKKGDYVRLSPYLCKRGDRINNAIFMVRYILMGIRNNERLIRLTGFDSMMRQDDIISVDLKETAPDEFVFDPDLMRVEYSHTVADGYSSSPVFQLTDIKESIKDGDFVKFKDSITSFGKDASSTVFKVENIGLYTIVKLRGIPNPVRLDDLEKVDNWKEKGYVFAGDCHFYARLVREKGKSVCPERVVLMYVDRSVREEPDDGSFEEFKFASEVLIRTGNVPERCDSDVDLNNNNSEKMKKKDDIKRGDYVAVKEEFCRKGNPINKFMFEVKDMYISDGVLYLRLESFLTTADRKMFEKVKDESSFLYSKEKAMYVCCGMNDSGIPEYSVVFKAPESNTKKDTGVTSVTRGNIREAYSTTKVNQYAKFEDKYVIPGNVIAHTKFEVLFTKIELGMAALKGTQGGIPLHMLRFSTSIGDEDELFNEENQVLVMEGEVGNNESIVFGIKDREKKLESDTNTVKINNDGELIYNKECTMNSNGEATSTSTERPSNDYKNDFIDGKTRWDLIPWGEIEDLAELYTEGAKKYKPGSWKNLKDGFERYGAAAMRHYMKYRNGERYDPETGAHHLTAVVWNAIAMLWFDKHGEGLLLPEVTNNDTKENDKK